MSEIARIWKIDSTSNALSEIARKKLPIEMRLETWIENDIAIISDDLLIIGRQLTTSFGGIIDLLGIDRLGDLVVIELKRDCTRDNGPSTRLRQLGERSYQ